MHPIISPGAVVVIDETRRRIATSGWTSEFDRPIYFIELRDSYACSWVELRGSELTLIPHPLSGTAIRQFPHPQEAEIIGQVTGVAMRLVPAEPPDATPK